MPTLPACPSLEHLRKQAKRLHKAVRSQTADAMALAGPYFGNPSEISLQQAQLVVARTHGFDSWVKLKRHVETGGGNGQTTEQHANRFLDLVCLHYGPDTTRGAEMFDAAADLLRKHPEIAQHSLHTAAATGDVDALNRMLAAQPLAVDNKGGPFHWTPLMYAAYARLPGTSTFESGKALLAAGADPNAHYMWGGTYRFAVLTGIFGDGEGGKTRLPEHPDIVPFARAVLDAGASPNDCQGAYNRSFSPDDTHLKLMLEYGLKDSDPSDWWLTEDGRSPGDHRTMHFQLIGALRHGYADRARLLIEHGVDLDRPDSNCYSTFTVGYTPYQVALMRGMPQIAALIKAKGGRCDPLAGPEQFQAACMAGDPETARRLASEHQGRAPAKEAEMLREAAGNGNMAAVTTMIALGFELNPPGTHTALHSAAWKGHTDVIAALLAAGADSTLRDPDHYAPPLGHAMHGQHRDAIDLLMDARMDIFLAAAMNNTGQIAARLADDPTWINAPFARIRPRPDKDWPNDWAPPLWYAAMNGRTEAVNFLLTQGADPAVTDPSGRLIAQYAREAGHEDVAALLDAAHP